ncbi:hypothetical protein [Azospirillum doebereinerae]
MTTETLLDIFATGQHTAMSGETLAFSERDLAATAAAYDSAVYDAPLCVGHPTTNAPAYGWVSRLECRDGHLFAAPTQVDPAFKSMVQAGRFKKISASFYRPDAKDNPTPGVWALRHVGFLGAAAPAVLGLKPAQFAGTVGDIVTFGDVLDQREAELAEREAAFAAREARVKAEDVAAFVGRLVQQGRFPIGMKDEAVEILRAIDDRNAVAFAASDGGEGETVSKTPLQALKDLMSRLPTMVMFGEAAPDSRSIIAGEAASFAAPTGYRVDASGADLDRRARAYQEKHGGTYGAAVRAVSR